MKDYQKYINMFRALANEDRIKMIKLLKEKEMYAKDIESNFYMEQSTASHHLNILKKAGILKSRKEGRYQYYSINKGFIEKDFKNFVDLLE